MRARELSERFSHSFSVRRSAFGVLGSGSRFSGSCFGFYVSNTSDF
jgi:hypothetical protein